MITLDQLNMTDAKQFIAFLGGIFEHSPWIAEQAASARPFLSIRALHNHMVQVVQTAPKMQQLALIKAHPHLGNQVELTSDSEKEQQRAGLNDMTANEYEKFQSLNQQYLAKFDFPFIKAVWGHNKSSIFKSLEDRLNNNQSKEFQTALLEIYQIALFRLQEKIIDKEEIVK